MENVTEILTGLIAALGGIFIVSLITLGVSILILVALWKCFVKMGDEGWKAIIPFYNAWTLCRLVHGSGLMMFTWWIPFAGPIFTAITYWKLFAGFGKGVIFNILALFFRPIAVMICGFGKSQYIR